MVRLSSWVEREVSRLVLEAPENRLQDFGGQPIFDVPLVGIADGDDPLFVQFRDAVSRRHMLPREALQRSMAVGGAPAGIRVITWCLPFTEAIRRSNRGRSWPSRLYSLARNNGGALNDKVRRRLTESLRQQGYVSVAPVLTEHYDAFRSPEHTFASTWSERHVAYAAGLGQFGLNGSLITPLGANVRLGSVVTDMPVPPTGRRWETYRAPCLNSHGEACGRCVEKCPAGAISAQGLDKSRCYAMRQAVRESFFREYVQESGMLTAPVVKGGERCEGYSLGCALCQCGVPCESCFPAIFTRIEGKDA